MTSGQMKQFMRKLENELLPDFTINQDKELTTEILSEVQLSAAETFTGNKCFTAGKMLCTGKAYESNGHFILLKDGIVYGPYITLYPGSYDILFDFSADGDITAIISITSGGELIKTEEVKVGGVYTLSVSFLQEKTGLEFTLTNLCNKRITFNHVQVTLSKVKRSGTNRMRKQAIDLTGTKCKGEILPQQCANKDYDVQEDEKTVITNQTAIEYLSSDTGSVVENDMQQNELSEESLSSELLAVNELGKCELPKETNARLSKRIVRRIINCYTGFQINFNEHLVNLVMRLNDKVNHVVERENLYTRQLNQWKLTTERKISEQEKVVTHVVEGLKETLSRWKTDTDKRISEQEKALTHEVDSVKETQNQWKVDTDKRILEQEKVLDSIVQKRGGEIKEEILKIISNDLKVTDTRINRLYDEIESIWKKIRVIDTQFESEWSNNTRVNGAIDKIVSCLGQVGDTTEIVTRLNLIETDIEKRSRADSSRIDDTQHNIDDIFEKIKQIDNNFEAEWNNGRRINSELEKIWKSQEILRNELFYEVDHRMRVFGGADSVLKTARMKQEPIIKDSANVICQQNGGKLKLNLGCGNLPVEGYINVDARDLPGVDIVANVDYLPYENYSVDEIFSAHLIEHFEYKVMKFELMPYWYSLLSKNGMIRVIFPDAKAMVEAYNNGEISFEQLSYVIMGAQDYDKDYHFTMYSIDKVKELLKTTGFVDISVVTEKRKNGECLESEIIAYKR